MSDDTDHKTHALAIWASMSPADRSQAWERMSPRERDVLRDRSGLTPQLIGLEGWRVEVQDGRDTPARRFIVGSSTGWRPCHLEVKTIRSSGGEPAAKAYYSVKKLERVR